MNNNSKMVSNSDIEREEQKDIKIINEIDFDTLFTPDANFDALLINEQTSHHSIKKQISNDVSFVLMSDTINSLILAENQVLKKPFVENIWFPELHPLDNSKWANISLKEKQVINEKEIKVISALEKEYPFYLIKFQEILALNSEKNLEELFNRYVKISLYILEQFDINLKKRKIIIMMSLKRELKEIITEEETKEYINII